MKYIWMLLILFGFAVNVLAGMKPVMSDGTNLFTVAGVPAGQTNVLGTNLNAKTPYCKTNEMNELSLLNTNNNIEVRDPTNQNSVVNLQTLNRMVQAPVILWFYASASPYGGMLLMSNAIPTFADQTLVATNPSAGDYVFSWVLTNTNLLSVIYNSAVSVDIPSASSGANPNQYIEWKPELYVSNTVSGLCPEYGETAERVRAINTFPLESLYANIYPPTNRNINMGQEVVVLKIKVLANPSSKNLQITIGSSSLSDMHLSGNTIVASSSSGATFTGGDIANNLRVSNSAPRVSLFCTNGITSSFYMENVGNKADVYIEKTIQKTEVGWGTWTNLYQSNMVARWDFTSTNGALSSFVSTDDTWPNSVYVLSNVTAVLRTVIGTNQYGRTTYAAEIQDSNYLLHTPPLSQLASDYGVWSTWFYNTNASGYYQGIGGMQNAALSSCILPWHQPSANSIDVICISNSTVVWRATIGPAPAGAWRHVIIAMTNNAPTADFYLNGTKTTPSWETAVDRKVWWKSLINGVNPVSQIRIGNYDTADPTRQFRGFISSQKWSTNAFFSATDAWNLYTNTIPTNNIEAYKGDAVSNVVVTTLAMSISSNGIVSIPSMPTNNIGIGATEMWSSNGIIRFGP